MKKITIISPQQKSDYWILHWGSGGTRKRKAAPIIFNIVERKLLRSQNREKIAIAVKYGKDTSDYIMNETIASDDPKYLLYALLCFLEEFLNKNFIKRKEFIYCPTI